MASKAAHVQEVSCIGLYAANTVEKRHMYEIAENKGMYGH